MQLRGSTIMWALIMTLSFKTAYDHTSYFQSTLDNFKTEEACRYAGAQQELALRTDFRLNTSKFYTFVCVPKD